MFVDPTTVDYKQQLSNITKHFRALPYTQISRVEAWDSQIPNSNITLRDELVGIEPTSYKGMSLACPQT